MARRHDHTVRPAIAGQRHQRLVLGQCLGGNADVGLTVEQHFRHLLGRTLMQLQLHVRIAAPEVVHRIGQRVTRLRMGGGNAQLAGRLAGVFLSHPQQVLGARQNALDDGQRHGPGLGQRGQPLAGPHEQLEAQFLFQFANLAAHAGLRRVQRPRHFREIEAAARGLADGTQLLEIHGAVSESVTMAPMIDARPASFCAKTAETAS